MKRIRCPKCDEPILFDDSLYAPGRVLVFECTECRKQFKIRVGVKPSLSLGEKTPGEDLTQEQESEQKPLGYLIVIENAFHFRQEIPLFEGENRVGRYVKGTKANAAIKTVDPSVDNTHCRIRVSFDARKEPKFSLQDGPSGTGTFHMNTLLGNKERVDLEEGAIITIGATTMILQKGEKINQN